MQRTLWRSLAAVSLATLLIGATRPRYGGTLRLEMQAPVSAIEFLDPPFASLVFDRLVRFDEEGRVQPALATSWQADADRRRWQFRLRPKVRLHDGSMLTPAAVAAALQPVLEGITVAAGSDAITFQSAQPVRDLPQQLTRPRTSIIVRTADGAAIGSGPFKVTRWQAGHHASLTAHEDYWGGRPFLDGLEIEMGRSMREQRLTFELGKADLIEVAPADVKRFPQVWTSLPAELICLVASHPIDAVPALSTAIDRTAIQNVILQRQGEPAGGLLPQWLSGYAFLFSVAPDLPKARQLAAGLKPVTLAPDAGDPLGRLIAERVALNGRDAGLNVQVAPHTASADLRLMRVALRGPDPASALAQAAAALGLDAPPAGPDLESVYRAEAAVLASRRIIPLVHVRRIVAVSPKVQSWLAPGLSRDGEIGFPNLWVTGQ